MYCMLLSSHMNNNNNSTKQKKIVTDSSKRTKNQQKYTRIIMQQQKNILGISFRTPTAHFSHKYHYHNCVFTHLLFCARVCFDISICVRRM